MDLLAVCGGLLRGALHKRVKRVSRVLRTLQQRQRHAGVQRVHLFNGALPLVAIVGLCQHGLFVLSPCCVTINQIILTGSGIALLLLPLPSALQLYSVRAGYWCWSIFVVVAWTVVLFGRVGREVG